MLKEDFVIQSNVRQILIRSNIDYSRITFGTVKGVVYVRGAFKSTFHHTDGKMGSTENPTGKSLQSLEKKIKGIPGVIDIEFELTNWTKEGGQWIPRKTEEGG
ncbi:MAG TPA: hypothetical protein VMV04_23870 [Thermodesulfobacteriota bacterium]|nr:hypothetical protein [Thermodesulfobacteriota bacterium]